MTDQQRADCMGAAGNPVIQTPNMDRIAAEGMRFANAFTVSPLCMPARASFLSGVYPHGHGMWANAGQLPASDESVMHRLQAAGYRTAHIGKSHYYPHGSTEHMSAFEGYLHARGIEDVREVTGPRATLRMDSYMTDSWNEVGLLQTLRDDYRDRLQSKWTVRPSVLPTEHHMDSYVGRTAADYVHDYSDDRPMCLFVGFPGPHEPWDAPAEYEAMYRDIALPDPKPVPERIAGQPESIAEKDQLQPVEGHSPEAVRAIKANYYGKVSLIDHWIGEIMAAFEKRGWYDDLVVLFWSDHGEHLGDHGRVFKSTFHESSIAVPMMAKVPGVTEPGGVSEALVETIDLFPTLIELGRAEMPQEWPGRLLLELARGAEADGTWSVREAVLSEVTYRGERNTMVRTDRYKYAVDDTGLGFMLYDLQEDPLEQRNLAGLADNASLEADMRELLLRKLLETNQVCRSTTPTKE
jgi:choline-sulfatase